MRGKQIFTRPNCCGSLTLVTSPISTPKIVAEPVEAIFRPAKISPNRLLTAPPPPLMVNCRRVRVNPSEFQSGVVAAVRELPRTEGGHVVALLALLAAPPYSPDVAARLIGGALSDGVAYARVAELSDDIGPRLSGSPGAEAAVKWAVQRFRDDGLEVRTEPVKVPHWVRGEERAEVLPARGRVG